MLGFDESYLADLGRLIAAWSHVELQFDLLFLSIVVMRAPSGSTKTNPRMKLMGAGFKRRIEEFKKRIKELELTEERRKDVRDVLSRLVRYRDERDRIAHSVFSISLKGSPPHIEPTEATGLYKSWKSNKEPEFTTVTQDHLQKTFKKFTSFIGIYILFHLIKSYVLRTSLIRDPKILIAINVI